MGGEHTRTGKHLYLCFACMITIFLSGCSLAVNFNRQMEARDHLSRGEHLLEQGNLEQSLKENEEALSLAGSMKPGDRALFNMGLIYAHYNNPAQDYAKALYAFRRLTETFPESPLAEQAKTWMEALATLETAERERMRAEKTAETPRQRKARTYIDRGEGLLRQGNFKQSLLENEEALSLSPEKPPGDDALFNMALVYAHYKNPDKDYRKAIDYFRQLIAAFPESPLVGRAKIWIAVLDAIEKAKQVDIEIEKKRKELTR